MEYGPVKEAYGGYGYPKNEPRIFFSDIFAALGITTQTIYKYSTTATTISTSFVVSSCVPVADPANPPTNECNSAGRRRRMIEAIERYH